MDAFDCCTRVSCSDSCMKRDSKNAVLKLKEVHSHLLVGFSFSTARVEKFVQDVVVVHASFLQR